ncbi:unnamed protein product [Mesocestoides corti]|uniref:AB hydrolase-1 domain-containing protein n=2 Tax=Mesocestoides corti TaxID=53468 RepID=A0A0R3U1I0_MESCO|nr:unnamed protein product [Mesocestoides corti]
MTLTVSPSDSDLYDKSEDSWWHWIKWIPTSNEKLVQAEDKILQRCKCKLEKFFLPIFNSTLFLRTIIARNWYSDDCTEFESRVPLVLIHGFASGVGLWCKNLDSLSASRTVYAFDMLGFGRSSRPPFPNTAEEVENKFVEVIEEWRKTMNLDKFILLGHSMGGFLASSYALSHPERVVHLVLIDPWGFIGQQESTTIPVSGFRAWLLRKLSSFRALATMRMVGPFGLNAMRKVRQDFEQVFYQQPWPLDEVEMLPQLGEIQSDISEPTERRSELPLKASSVETTQTSIHKQTKNNTDFDSISPFDPAVVYNYIYHINVRHPSGEDAFRSMSQVLGWAARPMLHRIPLLDSDVPITFIYGGRSWVDMSSGLRVRSLRPNSYVDVMVIEGGGHHAYAQYADEFNAYVNAIARLVDRGHDFRPGSEEFVQLEMTPAEVTTPPSPPEASGNHIRRSSKSGITTSGGEKTRRQRPSHSNLAFQQFSTVCPVDASDEDSSS